MALDASALLAAMAAIIGLGFLANLVFERWRVPDVIALIVLGMVLGPGLNVFPPAAFAEVAPTLGAFALLVIMFDAGLSIHFSDLRRGLARAGYLAAVGWTLTAVGVALILSAIEGWPLHTGLLLGAVLGGSSSIIVIPILTKMGAPERLRVTLSIESALTDVLCVVGALVIAAMITSGNASLLGFGGSVAYRFAVAAIVGLAAGLAWTFVWPKVERRSYAYMITLAAIIGVDVGVEFAGGSGPIGVLLFGIVLGNEFRLFRRVTTATWHLEGEMRRFHGEIVFFFRAFFFVGLGVIIDPQSLADPEVLWLGALVIGAVVGGRAVAVYLLGLGSPAVRSGRWLMFLMMPRGLAAAVLAGAPAVAAAPGSNRFLPIAFLVILATNGIAMLAPFASSAPSRGPAGSTPSRGVIESIERNAVRRKRAEEDEARLRARAERLEEEQALVAGALEELRTSNGDGWREPGDAAGSKLRRQ